MDNDTPRTPSTPQDGELISPTRPEAAGESTTGVPGADGQTVARLEREARELARVDGCAGGQCAAMPAGSKACGGPRYYLPYCTRTTDTAALRAKLDELQRVESDFNRKHGVVSDCMMIMEPNVQPDAQGRCVVQR